MYMHEGEMNRVSGSWSADASIVVVRDFKAHLFWELHVSEYASLKRTLFAHHEGKEQHTGKRSPHRMMRRAEIYSVPTRCCFACKNTHMLSNCLRCSASIQEHVIEGKMSQINSSEEITCMCIVTIEVVP
jgi:hypothetical protein